jgi:hypothetical protein
MGAYRLAVVPRNFHSPSSAPAMSVARSALSGWRSARGLGTASSRGRPTTSPASAITATAQFRSSTGGGCSARVKAEWTTGLLDAKRRVMPPIVRRPRRYSSELASSPTAAAFVLNTIPCASGITAAARGFATASPDSSMLTESERGARDGRGTAHGAKHASAAT